MSRGARPPVPPLTANVMEEKMEKDTDLSNGGFQQESHEELRRRAKFELAEVPVTVAGASRCFLHPDDVSLALCHHRQGHWGDVCPTQRQTNEKSLLTRGQLRSHHYGRDGNRFWILTYHGWSETIVVVPEDYPEGKWWS